MKRFIYLIFLSGFLFSSVGFSKFPQDPNKPLRQFQSTSMKKIIRLKDVYITLGSPDGTQKGKDGKAPPIYVPNTDMGSVVVGQSSIVRHHFVLHAGVTKQNLYNYYKTPSSSPDMAVINDTCVGVILTQANPACYFDFIYTPTSPSTAWMEFQATSDVDDIPDNTHVLHYFATGSSFEKPVEKPACESGSVIRIDNFSVSEGVPVVGTDITLNYSSEYAAQYSTTTGSLSSIVDRHSFNFEGWTNSLQHLYSQHQRRLFLGTGTSVSRDYSVLNDGNLMVVSPNRDEIYIFSSNGRHLETKTFVTGAIKYSFSYDANGRLVSITDAYSNVTTFNRNTFTGKLTSIVAPFGQTTTISIDANGYLASIANPNSEVYQATYYTGTELLQTFTKPGGQVSTMTYNGSAKLSSDTSHGGNSWTLNQGTSGDITKVSQLGRQTYYGPGRDNYGNYTRVEVQPYGFVSSSYQGYHDDSGYSSPIKSDWTTMGFDPRFAWSAKRKTSYTYAMAGNSSYTSYDQTVAYSNGVTPYYFNFDTLTDTSVTSGRTYTSVFDNTTKTRISTTPESATQTTIYNSNEQVISSQVGSDTATTTSYDSSGRVIATSQNGQNELNYSYHSTSGFLESVTNGRGETISYVRDLVGRIVSIILPDTRTIQYTYDANGNKTSVTPPNRPAHQYTFNAMELPSQYSPPTAASVSSKDTTYTYDLDKQLTQITRPDGKVISYNYDSVSGLLANIAVTNWGTNYINYIPNTNLVGTTYSYYNMKSSSTYYGDQVESNSLFYSPNNFLYGKVFFGFDTDHRIVSRTVHGNNPSSSDVTSITLNDDNQPVQYGMMSMTYSYPSGRLSQTQIASSDDTRTYDSYGNLATYNINQDGTSIYSYSLTRDNMSRIIGINETIQGVTSQYLYGYNSTGQLTAVSQDGTLVASFVYDDNGNRTSTMLNGTTYSAVFDNQDRMTSYGANTYTYNPNGELYQMQNSLSATTSYSADPFGNLYQVTYPSSTYSRYYYDAHNRLVGRYYPTNYTRMFIREDEFRVSAIAYTNGILQKIFYYATGAITPDYMDIAGIKYRIITNHLGSPRLVVRLTDGVVVQRMNYNVLGQVTYDSYPSLQPFGFAGGLYDADSGLVHFGARKYDTYTGRWISKDPIRFDGGDTNLYGYVMNDPVNAVDPSGLMGVGSDKRRNDVGGGGGANGFSGRSGYELKIKSNSAGEVCGRSYSGHAFDRMQGRGITPSVVENTITTGLPTSQTGGATKYFDPINDLTVILNSSGRVITVFPGGK